MHRPKKRKHIHPFKAYTYIGIALFVSIWLISSANPGKALAEDDASFSDIITQKDTAAQNELLKPDVVLPVEVIEVADNAAGDVPDSPTSNDQINIVILPKGPNQNVKSKITIVASAPIDPKTFQKSFTILPAIEGTYSVNGRVATFTPKNNLIPQTSYTVIADKSLKGVNGESLAQNISQDFTTQPDLKMLTVPYYRQQYSRSCEAASLRMALAYKGTAATDMEIINAAGYNPTEPNWATRVWDNPYEMFVGYVDGAKVGYGMYAEALAKAANRLGHGVAVLKNPTLGDLATEVLNGNPIVIWGYINGTVPKLSYFMTPDGQRIPIYSNEHARVITGVVGNAENPVGFYVNDPLSGKANEYWTAENLQKHMSIFGGVSNQALVVK